MFLSYLVDDFISFKGILSITDNLLINNDNLKLIFFIIMPKFFNRCCISLILVKYNEKLSPRGLPGYSIVHFSLSTSDRVCSACHKKLLRQYAEALPDDTDNECNESFGTDENLNDEPIYLNESPDFVISGIHLKYFICFSS